MNVPVNAIGIILQSFGDERAIEATYNSLQSQQERESPSVNIILWCTNCSGEYVKTGFRVVQSKCTFLSSLKSSLGLVTKFKHIILCKAGVVFHPNWIDTVLQKKIKYGDEAPLSVLGIRLFPHESLQPGEMLREGVHWKAYDHKGEDRAVHFLTTDLCFFSVDVLKQIVKLDYDIPLDTALEGLWISFLIGYYLNLTVWKIKCAEVDCIPRITSDAIPQTFYTHIFTVKWPKDICNPYYWLRNESTTVSRNSPALLWEHGFGGINMPIEPASETDFKAAAAYGITVIRVGAMCDSKDMNFLLDPTSKNEHGDRDHLLLVLPRLKKAIKKATSEGLKVILTMSDLPGCPFYSSLSSPNSCFWSSAVNRIRAARFWGVLAESLIDIKSSIMGYDLISEPYTPKDQNAGYFDDISTEYKEELYQFYTTALEEIRKYDKDTMVIITTTYFASPRAIDMLTPLPDSNVAYSVHFYGPPQLTFPRRFECFKSLSLSYPGSVPKWRKNTSERVEINFQYLYFQLETVYKWQMKYNIPANRVLIGEFGTCREVIGSQQFLTDLVAIFTKFKWHWLLFSFRDEEWDAMDYELGPDLNNMLDRGAHPLFLCVAKHFY
ncbi:uncharacterized protein [Dysidea avara]|uniref:uncharacterized protein n=1 Tax=Dysidea avara TaxID=196820 RepID=UPI003326A529